ncbi:MAG: response regulator transcription factor [Planctomycetaceae bacterium]
MPTAPDTTPAPRNDRGLLTCLIVEDQAMFLELLAGMMTMHGNVRIVARAGDVASGRAACLAHRPDVLILDLALPDGTGLDVARPFIEANPLGRVVVVSGQASDFACPAWLNDNLQAVISKHDAFESLRRELDELTGSAARGPAAAEPAAAPLLTDREAEVFRLVGEGLTSRAIAQRLGISEHTVQSHRKRIAAKLGTSGDEMVRRAIAQRAVLFSAAPP